MSEGGSEGKDEAHPRGGSWIRYTVMMMMVIVMRMVMVMVVVVMTVVMMP